MFIEMLAVMISNNVNDGSGSEEDTLLIEVFQDVQQGRGLGKRTLALRCNLQQYRGLFLDRMGTGDKLSRSLESRHLGVYLFHN